VLGDEVVEPEKVEAYLKRSFGDDLVRVRSAMTDLAGRVDPAELARQAYGLYEQFRPSVPAGVRGWGARGELDLGLLRSLGPHPSPAPRKVRTTARPVRRKS
jgi:hypothetical protein